MADLTDQLGQINLGEFYAYVDTLKLHFHMTKDVLRKLPLVREILRVPGRYCRVVRFDKCEDRNKTVWGSNLVIQQPKREILPLLDELLERYRKKRSSLCTVDIAVDVVTDQPERLKQWWVEHGILRWRRRGQMFACEGTMDWVCHEDRWHKGMRGAARNLTAYADKPSKITGEDVAHLEVRFRRAHAVRGIGCRVPSDVLKLNPQKIFEKHVAFFDSNKKSVKRRITHKSLEP
jgi:hypothetical protein